MKNVLLGMIGILITLYTLLIGLNILLVQSHQNQLEKHLSRTVKNVLEGEFLSDDESAVRQMIQEEILDSISPNATAKVEIRVLDLQKGIISVRVIETVTTLTGNKKEIVMEKTAIVERSVDFLGGEFH